MQRSNRTTIEKISDVLSDAADIFSLGSRVVRGASELFTQESKDRFLAESKDRGEHISQSRAPARLPAQKKDGGHER